MQDAWYFITLGKPSKEKDDPDFIPSLFAFTKVASTDIAKQKNHNNFFGIILVGLELEHNIYEYVQALQHLKKILF